MNKETLSPNSQEILNSQSTNQYWLIDWLIGPYRDRIRITFFLSGDSKNVISHGVSNSFTERETVRLRENME